MTEAETIEKMRHYKARILQELNRVHGYVEACELQEKFPLDVLEQEIAAVEADDFLNALVLHQKFFGAARAVGEHFTSTPVQPAQGPEPVITPHGMALNELVFGPGATKRELPGAISVPAAPQDPAHG